MTAGHKHRHVRVDADGWILYLLTRPTLLVVGTRYADKSRMVFGPTERPDRWRLSPLGLVHGWTGLTLKTKEHDMVEDFHDELDEHIAESMKDPDYAAAVVPSTLEDDRA